MYFDSVAWIWSFGRSIREPKSAVSAVAQEFTERLTELRSGALVWTMGHKWLRRGRGSPAPLVPGATTSWTVPPGCLKLALVASVVMFAVLLDVLVMILLGVPVAGASGGGATGRDHSPTFARLHQMFERVVPVELRNARDLHDELHVLLGHVACELAHHHADMPHRQRVCNRLAWDTFGPLANTCDMVFVTNRVS